MTTVTATTATNAATTTKSTTTTSTSDDKNTLGYDAFLKLFIAELKNQDPTSPPDSSAFIAQLATFSNVEQSVNANTKLAALLSLSALTQANSLIGHTATSADGATSGIITSVTATSDGASVTLKDGNTIELGEGVKIS